MRNRQEVQDEIHSRGFNIVDMYGRRDYDGPAAATTTYNKVRVGTKKLDDAVLNLGTLPKVNRYYCDKRIIINALGKRDLKLLREISNYFYNTNGIYQSVCNYASFLYRYDWYIVPEVLDESTKEEKILKEFNNLLNYLDNTHIKKLCGDIALQVIKNGAYYGVIVPSNDKLILQELPINYCRSRFFVGDNPAVEFDMRFFDDNFPSLQNRLRILKMFPKDIQRGYVLFKEGKLSPDFVGDPMGSWYMLDATSTVKFNFNNSDIPMFVNSIPDILNLDEAQDLDRRKQMQDLLKVIIQKLPLDKNGDLIFDVDEARDIHNNAVEMLKHAIGVDVLTTFAEISVEDMADKNTTTTTDDLAKMERSVYNSFGISKNLFNTDGNLSLEKSILQDESTLRSLLLQFHMFFDRVTQSKCNSNKKKFNFKLYMLETTQYNYQNLAKVYKEQVQMGYSKMLPQIALGHSQSSIIHTAYFENEILHLSEIMIPPLMSSTINGEDILGKKNSSNSDKIQNNSEGSSSTKKEDPFKTKTASGRPEKEDSQKSEKTIQNKESMN